mgnify:CR=1 FL=1
MDQKSRQEPNRSDAEMPLSIVWWLYLPITVFVLLFLLFQFTTVLFGGWFDGERGALEIAQFLILVTATVTGVRLLIHPVIRRTPGLLLWSSLATFGVAYTAGEEISWAQHLVGWGTPDWWGGLNDQGETNFHNVSSWLDQKPRALLELGIVIGGIALPLLLQAVPRLRQMPATIIVPPLALLPLALLAELSRLGERARDVFGSQPEIVYRPSEVQELFFFWFALLYLIVLYKRIADEDAQPPISCA